MSNLTNNSVSLQNILAMVNALPESTDLTPIIEALTEKGQTVPDGASVDVLADLIAAIESGGGGGSAVDIAPFTQLLVGTYTPSSNGNEFTIPDEATGKVGFLLMFNQNIIGVGYKQMLQLCYHNLGYDDDGEVPLYRYAMGNSSSLSTTLPSVSTNGRTFTTAKSYMFAGGMTYAYVLGMVAT